jgi:hypothetical protein
VPEGGQHTTCQGDDGREGHEEEFSRSHRTTNLHDRYGRVLLCRVGQAARGGAPRRHRRAFAERTASALEASTATSAKRDMPKTRMKSCTESASVSRTSARGCQ